VARPVALVALVALVVAGCGPGPSAAAPAGRHHPTTTGAGGSTRGRGTPVTAASFSFESCAALVRSPLRRPGVDSRPRLLVAADLPAGAVLDGPHQTSTHEAVQWASVPSTGPAAYETATVVSETEPGGNASVTLDEVVGDVGSSALAAHLLSKLDAEVDGPGCNPGGAETLSLPGTSVTATVSGGETSEGTVRGAQLFAARGPRLLSLRWTSGVQVNPAGLRPVPAQPALPGAAAMAATLRAAERRLSG
jgi:hypothetical protein